MSKTMRSASRTRSHSASRSRSRSESHSRSRSRSSSRSRSRKHRYGSRSRSRSKSHSPPHNWERKQPREYQNHREFRGYHRGFRRPYYFRGRGRGFFRGRFQRGGGYNNFRSNNWQNFRQQPQQKQQQQQQYAHSPKRGHSHSCTPKKRSRSHSRRSDRSSSPHSHHSSSSSSSRQRSGSAQHSCKAAREGVCAPEEAQRSAGDETLSEQGRACAEAEGSTKGGRAPEVFPLPVNHDSSSKMASPQFCSAVTAGHADSAPSEAHSVSVSSGTTSNGSTCWQTVTSKASATSPSKKSPTTVFSGFGLFSDIDQQEDTIAMSMAFKKFLEEQKNKKQASVNTPTHKVADSGNGSGEKRSEALLDQSSGLCRPVDHNNKRESQKYKHVDRAPLLCEDAEEEEDEETEPQLPLQVGENATSKRTSKLPFFARELFEQQVSKLEHIDWDDELEAFLLSRKQERAASFLAALSKKEKLSRKFRELSPERPLKVKRKEKSTLSPSPTYAALPRRSSERREREMIMNMRDESPPPRHSGKRETEFSLRMDSLSDNLARSSVLSNDWRNAMDFVHPDKKEQEFHSVFQHIPCNKLCRSPSELFAQHLVAIVHHIKAQHFPSSGMTLNDRFAMYQRIAAEKEIAKPRKSPEIHRRIDVSPSAFKRHSLMFDELKGSVDSSFKVDGKQLKGDTVDLRLDIEHRKKYISRDPNDKQEGDGESGESPGSDMEISIEKSLKHHKKSKKSKKKQERSHSSSSVSALSHEEEAESTEETFSKAQLQLRECSGPMERGQQQFRTQARGWNKVNSFGNNSNSNIKTYVTVHPKNEDWDQEHMPKIRKYCLQVGKDGEGERKWAAAGGRGQPSVPRVKGRFILRRPTSTCTTNSSSSDWSHGKFQASSEDGERPGNSTEQDHKK
ncbi:thyroid hormone receptor-associated protein 3 isoform X1 [Electrophorus electricus]|uniref:thyroid hormone receptor-associated protein 3 isoform X1 n=1 Tax=Electrophorus electricus TaxID=8005 RepID=UPI0015CFD3FB|nr:thyroid hormone receptor-associated protein 3 isoform X1 [Electrophorus electricus]XP_026857379.2 thyroid hormone receptor-associated protein 3 isoform X1 [Electrophorus electricus]XP_026857380.2 thyroid hormone receptor-associated protein 3 isoform X1 [Electrophorus electricus]XP_035386760.1 thyroid hormone receptor-associated protein 3 isoform X1 [Electrophorus electricus]